MDGDTMSCLAHLGSVQHFNHLIDVGSCQGIEIQQAVDKLYNLGRIYAAF